MMAHDCALYSSVAAFPAGLFVFAFAVGLVWLQSETWWMSKGVDGDGAVGGGRSQQIFHRRAILGSVQHIPPVVGS